MESEIGAITSVLTQAAAQPTQGDLVPKAEEGVGEDGETTEPSEVEEELTTPYWDETSDEPLWRCLICGWEVLLEDERDKNINDEDYSRGIVTVNCVSCSERYQVNLFDVRLLQLFLHSSNVVDAKVCLQKNCGEDVYTDYFHDWAEIEYLSNPPASHWEL